MIGLKKLEKIEESRLFGNKVLYRNLSNNFSLDMEQLPEDKNYYFKS